MNKDLVKLAETIKEIRIAMFTTIESDGRMFSRPMATLRIEPKSFDGKLWFFTDKNSDIVQSIVLDQNVNLAYAEPAKQEYISVCGIASQVEDRVKMKELWSAPMKAWFPEGIDDPNIALVCVEVTCAELWDAPPSKVVELVGMVKAAATGERYHGEKHQHHIDVRGAH